MKQHQGQNLDGGDSMLQGEVIQRQKVMGQMQETYNKIMPCT
jgi:hypothetical protein